jgi:hypothetical protein
MLPIWLRGEVLTGFCVRNTRKRDDLEDRSIDGRIVLKIISNK